MLEFDPNREPVPPRDAATVVVARDAGGAIEVFCVERHMRSGFMGGAVVFPGGKVDASDKLAGWAERATELGPRARAFASDESDARAFAVAALRELLEEAAMLPVVGELTGERLEPLRRELAERSAAGAPGSALLELLRARDLMLDTSGLEAISRWVTPAAETRRYDTRFYLLRAPAGQLGRHDEHETTKSFWMQPSEILSLWAKGSIFLAPPTSHTLALLENAASVDAALAIVRRHPLEPVCPFFAQDGDQVVLALPGDPLYPDASPGSADPDGPTRFVLEDGRFVPRRAS